MRVIDPLGGYSQGNEAEFRKDIYLEFGRTYQKDRDVFIESNQRLCIQSSNGTWWRLSVDDSGAVTTEAVAP